MSDRELALMAALVMDSGNRWGEQAADFQVEDARAILTAGRPNWHFLTRPRGGSKTSDIAALTIAWLVEEARPFDRGYVIASNSQQAGLLVDAAAGFVARTPELSESVTVEAERILASNGAWVRVLPQSDSGSWGLLNTHLIVCDEFAQWPDTRGARRVWQAIRSTTQKTPGCRLVILTSAGEPSHWSYTEVFQTALREIERAAEQRRDPFWRVSETPGPVPWQDQEELEQLRNELLPSAYDRLVLNIWSESEERAISEEDYDAAAWPCTKNGRAPAGLRGIGQRTFGPRAGQKYIVTVDVGTVNDATVMVVAHRETKDGNDLHGVVIDHLERWQGSKKNRIVLEDVRRRVAELSFEYNRAHVHADPDQFVDSFQVLNKQGVRTSLFPFTQASVGQVATALVQAFHNRQVVIPDNPVLRDELLKVRLKDTSAVSVRLDHDKTGHDDQAVTIGMACHLLLAKQWTAGEAFTQMMKKQIQERQENPSSRDARNLSRFQRQLDRRAGRPLRERERQQRSCQHRWRVTSDGQTVCAYACGAVREAS